MLGKLAIHNPGNIRKSNDLFIGEIQPSSDAAFKEFANMSFGYRAMFKVLDSYRRRGIYTIDRIVRRYSEDNQQAYIMFVEQRTGFGAYEEIPNTKQAMVRLVAAMSRFENGIEPNLYEVQKGWDIKENIETAQQIAIGGFGTVAIIGLVVLIINKNKNT